MARIATLFYQPMREKIYFICLSLHSYNLDHKQKTAKTGHSRSTETTRNLEQKGKINLKNVWLYSSQGRTI